MSVSKEVEKAVEEAFRDCARARREVVRLLDSASLWARSSACAVSLLSADVAVSGRLLLGCFRFRNVDVGSSIVGAAAGFSASGFCAAVGAGVGASTPSTSSSSSGP